MSPPTSNHCHATLDDAGFSGGDQGVTGLFLFDTGRVSWLGWNFAGLRRLHRYARIDQITGY